MKTKISDHQLFSLAACFAISDTIIVSSSGVAALAKQDAWIAAIITPIVGLPFIWMYFHMGKLFPGKTLIDILESTFGKWFGWIISALFVVFICFLAAAQVIFYIGDFLKTEYMTETPLYALNLLLTFALVIAMLYGLEAFSRTAEVFVVVVTVLILVAIMMNLNNIYPENLTPVFEAGITPSLKGALFLSSYMTWPFVFVLMIYPLNTDQTKKTRNSMMYGYLLGAGINLICTITTLLVLGSTITARSYYPTYLMAKEINVGVITRVEGLVSFSWMMTEFIRIVIYFYAGTIGLCQLFKINNYKRIVFPLALVTLIYSGIVYPTAAYQGKWDTTTWVAYIAFFGGLVPMFILIIEKIKRRRNIPS